MTVFEAFQVSLLARYVTGTALSRTRADQVNLGLMCPTHSITGHTYSPC
jgi:hypothetical protein